MAKEYKIGGPFLSQFESKNLSLQGIAPFLLRDDSCNPNRSSSLLCYSNHILLVRVLRGGPNGPEIKRRKEALNWHAKNLPEYTQEAQLAILQGKLTDGHQVSVLARLVPRLENVVPATPKDAKKNPQIAQGLSKINWVYFKQLLRGRIFDSGEMGAKNFLDSFSNYFISNNIMVGKDKNGKEILFCDPDWFVTLFEKINFKGPKEAVKRICLYPFRGAIFLSRALFFKLLDIQGRIQNQISSFTVTPGLEKTF